MKPKRKILFFGGVLAAVCCVVPSHGDELPKIAQTLGEQHAASPRVICSTGGSDYSAGTGTVFGKTAREYTVGTNAHVVEGSNSITCQFFGDGCPVNVDATLWRMFYRDGEDFAVLTIPRDALEQYDPPILPLAPYSRAAVVKNEPISSAGCPKAREPMAWKGRNIGEFGKIRTFKPAPEQGQSGSGIAQWNGDYLELRSILCYKMDGDGAPREELDFDRNLGGALDFRNMYDALGVRGGTGATLQTVADDAPNAPRIVPAVASVPATKNVGGYSIRPAVARLTAAEVREMGVDVPVPLPVADSTEHPAVLFLTSPTCQYCKPIEPLLKELQHKGCDIRFVDISTPSGKRVAQNYQTSTETPQFIAALFTGPTVNAKLIRVVSRAKGAADPELLRVWLDSFFNAYPKAPPRVEPEPSPVPKPQTPRQNKPPFRLASYRADDAPTLTTDDVISTDEDFGVVRVETADALPETVEELISEQATGDVAGWYSRRVPRSPSSPSSPSPPTPAPSGPTCDPNDPTCNGENDAQTGLIGNAIGDAISARIEEALRERLTIAEAEIRRRVEAEISAVSGKIDDRIETIWATIGEKIDAVFADISRAATRCVWLGAVAVLGGFLWGRFGRRLKISWLRDNESTSDF